MPLYEVTAGKPPHLIGPRLIKAKNKAAALAYAVGTWVNIEKCDAERAHVLSSRSVKVEDASGITVEGDGTE
jgi:hypothetical protein